MNSIAHLALFGSMVAAAVGALTFCFVLGAFGFTPAEGQPDQVARRERLARIGRRIAGTGFGLAALFGVVGVAASPPVVSSLQSQLTSLRERVGDMVTGLGRIAEQADHLRIQVGEWPLMQRQAVTTVERADSSALALPDRLRTIERTIERPIHPARESSVMDLSALPRGDVSRDVRAAAPEPAPKRQPRTPESNVRPLARDVDAPTMRPVQPRVANGSAVREGVAPIELPVVAVRPPLSGSLVSPEGGARDTAPGPLDLVAPFVTAPPTMAAVPRGPTPAGGEKLEGGPLPADRERLEKNKRGPNTARDVVMPAERPDAGRDGRDDDRRGRDDGRNGAVASERTDRGPGGPRIDRAERGERAVPVDRADRVERVGRVERADRPERPDRIDRADRIERPDRIDRPDKVERMERPDRVVRPERIERVERPDRVDRIERPDPPRMERVERVERVEKVERRDRPEKPERGRH